MGFIHTFTLFTMCECKALIDSGFAARLKSSFNTLEQWLTKEVVEVSHFRKII